MCFATQMSDRLVSDRREYLVHTGLDARHQRDKLRAVYSDVVLQDPHCPVPLRSPLAKAVRAEFNRSEDRMSDFLELCRIAHSSNCGESPNRTGGVRIKEPVRRAKQGSAGCYDIIYKNNLWWWLEVFLHSERLIVPHGIRPLRGDARGRFRNRFGS